MLKEQLILFIRFYLYVGPLNEGEVGPYIQSERKDIYIKYAKELVEKGYAYYCFCSEEELTEQRRIADLNKIPYLYDGRCSRLSKEEVELRINRGDSYVIRQKMPKEGITEIDDLIYGKIKIDNSVLEDQILIKSDGFPTYNFANVIDDHLMNITHVIRGKEYLDQTAKYNLLYDAFGFEKPTYVHVAMVLGEDGNKLSKRNGDASFMDLYDQGYLPDAIVNYLALLGWSPSTNQEIFTIDELIENFDCKRIGKSSSQYDAKKLQWVNAHYIKKLSIDELLKITVCHLENAYNLSDRSNEWIKHLVSIYQNHISYGKEIVDVTSLFFKDDVSLDDECKEFMEQDGVSTVIDAFKCEIEKISEWNVDNISAAINNVKISTGIKGKMLYMPIRIKVSGQMHGPELPDTIYLLGKDVVLNRLSK